MHTLQGIWKAYNCPASGYKQNSSQSSTEETSPGHTGFLNALLTGSLTFIWVMAPAIISGAVLNQMEAALI